MAVEDAIPSALFAHLAALTLSPAMPVAWEDVNFTPPSTGYVRATYHPNTVQQITLGDLGINRFIGLFQVDVFWPQGQGIIQPSQRVAAISAHFKRGTDIAGTGVTVRIIQPPQARPALESAPYVQIPVMIRWQADAANPS